MDFSHYTAEAVTLAVDLVNDYATTPREAEGAGDEPYPSLVEFLQRHGCDSSAVTDAELAAVRSLADRLFEVFATPDETVAVGILNDLLAEAGTRPHISGHDDHDWHLHYAPDEAGPARRLTANAAMGLAVVVCDHGTHRLGACSAHECRDVYVDTSRNRGRRYCSDSCTNRANVAAFRSRKRAAAQQVGSDQP